MIRKAIIMVLALGSLAFGTLGAVVGSGCDFLWNKTWHFGGAEEPGSRSIEVVVVGKPRLMRLSHYTFLNAPEPPWEKQLTGDRPPHLFFSDWKCAWHFLGRRPH